MQSMIVTLIWVCGWYQPTCLNRQSILLSILTTDHIHVGPLTVNLSLLSTKVADASDISYVWLAEAGKSRSIRDTKRNAAINKMKKYRPKKQEKDTEIPRLK